MSKQFNVLTMIPNINRNLISVRIEKMNAEDTLHEMYRILNCDMVTCVNIEVKGKSYDIWCDDEALLKNRVLPTLYLDDDIVIFGGLLFTTLNENGETTGLSFQDIGILADYIKEQDKKLEDWVKRFNEKMVKPNA